MADPFREQKIQNWAAEFADSGAVTAFPASLREYAALVAETFLSAACRARDVEPDALNESDLKSGLLAGVGGLALPQTARLKTPDFCAVFLEMLQGQGRVPPGRSLPAFVRALRTSFCSRTAASGRQAGEGDAPKPRPIVRPASKLGPNDPCPCGSGKKFKKCCQRLLG